MFALISGDVKILDGQGHVKPLAQVTHKLLIAHRFLSTKVKIAVCRAAVTSCCQQRTQERHRVGTAAQRYQHWLLREKLAFLVGQDTMDEFHLFHCGKGSVFFAIGQQMDVVAKKTG